MNKSWKDAIIAVLSEAGEAMHYADIAEQIVEKGLRDSVGATPAKTVYATIHFSMREETESSPFYKAARGYFGLREHQVDDQGESINREPETESPADEEPDQSVIRAFGMYWLRSNVYWKNKPSILGRQQLGADPVDFANQRGVYLLHDRRSVVYVGRCTERALGQRLYEHTQDRLNGRWDRFSWFGLYGVSEDGSLIPDYPSVSGEAIIAAFESLLIESLEPPQNRRRGDNLNAVEFMQARDPEIGLDHRSGQGLTLVQSV